MTQNRRSWIFVVIFWLLFLVSIGLNERYPWVHTAWVFAALLFAIVGSVFSISEMFRHSDGSGEYVYYRGVPRWMRWFVLDDEEYAKDKERQRIADRNKPESKSG
jgi:amino acid transporter